MNAVDTHEASEVSTTRHPISSFVRLWAVGTGIAVLLVASAYQLAVTVSGPLVVTDIGEITLGNVTGFTLLGSTIGAAMASVIGRFTRKPRMVFGVVATIALAGYAVVPFTAAESVETAMWLNSFHLLVAIPVIGTLARSLPTNRTRAEA